MKSKANNEQPTSRNSDMNKIKNCGKWIAGQCVSKYNALKSKTPAFAKLSGVTMVLLFLLGGPRACAQTNAPVTSLEKTNKQTAIMTGRLQMAMLEMADKRRELAYIEGQLATARAMEASDSNVKYIAKLEKRQSELQHSLAEYKQLTEGYRTALAAKQAIRNTEIKAANAMSAKIVAGNGLGNTDSELRTMDAAHNANELLDSAITQYTADIDRRTSLMRKEAYKIGWYD